MMKFTNKNTVNGHKCKISIFIVMIISLIISGCASKSNDSLFLDERINYNCIYSNGNLWFNETDVVYSTSGFYNTNIYHREDNKIVKLISDNDLEGSGSIARGIQCFDDYVYFYRQTSNESTENKFQIFRISIDERNADAEVVVSTGKPIFYWTILDDSVVYLTKNDSQEYYTYSLWYCKIGDTVHKKISEQTGSFGIMDEDLVFIEESADTLKIFKYNFTTLESDEVGFLDKFEEAIRWHHYLFNYTDDMIVFVNLNDSQEIHIYDVEDKKEHIYTTEEPIVDISCYNKSAYLLTNNRMITYQDPNTKKRTCVYKMNLTDGTTRLITDEFDAIESIYASSNDYVYLLNYVDNPLVLSSYEVIKITDDGIAEILFEY